MNYCFCKTLYLAVIIVVSVAIAPSAKVLADNAEYRGLRPEKNPDPKGDYYSNEAPVKGTVPSENGPTVLMRGSLWRVVSSNINCYSAPGANNRIIQRYARGNILQAEVYSGGSDEVLLNARDRTGKPWMQVRGSAAISDRNSRVNCYVRANKLYIQPHTVNSKF